MVQELIESGVLVELLTGSVGSETSLSIVYPEREFVPPQVRAFVDSVVAWAPQLLEPLVCPAHETKQEKKATRLPRGASRAR